MCYAIGNVIDAGLPNPAIGECWNMKSESATFQPQSIKKVPKRIVFQLDVSLDILHYCAWTDAINEERNCGTIRDFREALHRCKIIHPDDVDAYEQFIQSESSPSAVPKVELRLFTSSANYEIGRASCRERV